MPQRLKILTILFTPAMFLPAAGPVEFDRDVKPIFATKCFGCHGSSQQQSGLRLDKRQNALRGGDYGVVIVPGKSAESKLIKRLTGPEAGMQMPPTGPLSSEEIGVLKAWIDQGADFPATVKTESAAPAKPVDPKTRAFLDAVRRGDVAAAKQMLRRRRSLAKARDAAGSTALMHAAVAPGVGTLRLLLEAGADPKAKNRRDATALLWAATDPAKVRLLLEHGVEINAKSVEGRTPLYLAAMQPSGTEVARLLLEKGADASAKDITGRTPLMAAAGAGNVESMRLLLDKGAAANARTEAGSTALMDAVRSKNLQAVQLLLDRGADVNAATKRNSTALAVAASWGSEDIAKLLLEKGARVDTKDDRGYTPLMYAAYSESMSDQVVRMLLAKGADLKATGEGETALTLASKRGETAVLRLLKEAEGRSHVQ